MAPGTVVEMIPNVWDDPTVIDRSWVTLAGVGSASVTPTVNAYVPTDVGVPDRSPESASRVRPGGSEPEVTDQVYGVMPPVALSIVSG